MLGSRRGKGRLLAGVDLGPYGAIAEPALFVLAISLDLALDVGHGKNLVLRGLANDSGRCRQPNRGSEPIGSTIARERGPGEPLGRRIR